MCTLSFLLNMGEGVFYDSQGIRHSIIRLVHVVSIISFFYSCYVFLYYFAHDYTNTKVRLRHDDSKRYKMFSVFHDFNENLFKKEYNVFYKSLWMIFVLAILPIIIVIINRPSDFSGIKSYLSLFGSIVPEMFWPLWLTLFGLFMTSKVYLELKEKKVHSYDEFTSALKDFLLDIREGDKVYIILPTLYIKALHKNEFIDDIERPLFRAINNGAIFKIALLDYDVKCFEELVAVSKDKRCRDEFDGLYESLFERDASPKIAKFHNYWYPKDEVDNKEDYMFGLCGFVTDLHNKILRQRSSFKQRMGMPEYETGADDYDVSNIYGINKDYFELSQGDKYKDQNEDFVMIANVTKGEYYIGGIHIYKQEDVRFDVTRIQTKTIHGIIIKLFTDFVAENAQCITQDKRRQFYCSV